MGIFFLRYPKTGNIPKKKTVPKSGKRKSLTVHPDSTKLIARPRIWSGVFSPIIVATDDVTIAYPKPNKKRRINKKM